MFLRMSLHTFHCWGGHVFIMHIVPNLRVARILSYWMRYFLPLSSEILKEKMVIKDYFTFLMDEIRFIG